MRNAFELATDAIFCDPNMGLSAVYKSKNASARRIRVIKGSSRDDVDFGESEIFNPKITIDIKKSDIAEPRIGDTISIQGKTFVIHTQPKEDDLSIVWTCEVREQ